MNKITTLEEILKLNKYFNINIVFNKKINKIEPFLFESMKYSIYKIIQNKDNIEIYLTEDILYEKYNDEICKKSKGLRPKYFTIKIYNNLYDFFDIKEKDNEYLDLKLEYIRDNSDLKYIDWVQEKLSLLKSLYL